MSRGAGFTTADVSVALLDDPKVRALVRSTRDEGVVARCLVGYIATLTSSWAAGDRIALAEAAPVWLTGLEDLALRLRDVELLDHEDRIPEHAWAGWFGPAAQRRDDRRFEGLVGGLMRSLALDRKAAEAEARRRLATARPEPDGRETSGGPRPDLTRSVPSTSVPIRSVPGSSDPTTAEPAKSNATDSPEPKLTGRHRNGHGEPSLIEEGDFPDFLRRVAAP